MTDSTKTTATVRDCYYIVNFAHYDKLIRMANSLEMLKTALMSDDLNGLSPELTAASYDFVTDFQTKLEGMERDLDPATAERVAALLAEVSGDE